MSAALQDDVDAIDTPASRRLTRDMKDAARRLSDQEARYLVDLYYTWQENRIRAAHQQRALAAAGEPGSVFQHVLDESSHLEQRVKRVLGFFVEDHPIGAWMKAQMGIGPVIAAGMLAHIDIRRAQTAGAIWRYAGLDPTVTWGKGEKRPWNAKLKLVCWKAGTSFVKVSNRDGAVYGAIYRARKELEVARNESGANAEAAAASLAAKRIGATTDAHKAYAAGKLPAARLELRAQRYAVKRFLSDLHAVWFWHTFKRLAPMPWVITHGGHAHYVEPPNLEMFPGMAEALRALPPPTARQAPAAAPVTRALDQDDDDESWPDAAG